MRLVELFERSAPPRMQIVLPVVYKDETYRVLRKMGFTLLNDKALPNNQWSFVINNNFGKEPEQISDMLQNYLKFAGDIQVSPI